MAAAGAKAFLATVASMPTWSWIVIGAFVVIAGIAFVVSSARILHRVGDLDAPLDPASRGPRVPPSLTVVDAPARCHPVERPSRLPGAPW